MLKNKLFAIILFAILMLCFVGCSKQNADVTTTTTVPTETGTVAINEEQTIDTSLVGTWEELCIREPIYDEIIITETYHYVFNEDGTCQTLVVNREANVTKEEYIQIGSKWIEEKWDAKVIKDRLKNHRVDSIEAFLEKEYNEYMTIDESDCYSSLWSVEDGVLYSWAEGTTKAEGVSIKIKIENDILYIDGNQFKQVK